MMLTNVTAIEVRFVQPAAMRYDTVGDWQYIDRRLVITIARPVGTPMVSPALVAIHELLEAMFCDWHGVSQETVDAFDTSPARKGSEYEDEPGLDPTAPYHWEHMSADLIERTIAALIGLGWDIHDKTVARMADAVHEAKEPDDE